MEPWLSLSDIEEYIDAIPASVRKTLPAKLRPIVSEIVDGWLADMLQPGVLTAYEVLLADIAFASTPDAFLPTPQVSAEQYVNGRLIRKFMAYAVWSVYITRSNVSITETGLVNKSRDQAQDMTSNHRATLVAQYQGLAERAALKLSRLRVEEGVCPPASGYSGRPTIRKAQRKSPSRLGN